MATITTSNSPRPWFRRLSWLHTTTFLALITVSFHTAIVSCSKHGIPNYHDHCSPVVPESTPIHPETTTIPFPPNQDGYYLGGDEILNNLDSSRLYYSSNDRKILLFRTHHVYSTSSVDVFKVKAGLILQPSRITYGYSDSSLTVSSWTTNGALSFEIEGFWSKSTGKLCMMGSSSSYSREGKLHALSALVKIKDVKSSSDITSLVTGSLESLSSAGDSSYFHPISFLMFPLMNYTYTEVKKDADSRSESGLDVARVSLSLPLSVSICSVFSNEFSSFQLEYPRDSSHKNYSPFGESAGFLPQIMLMSSFQCSDDQRSLRFLLEFTNSSYSRYYSPFNPNTTWVAEASWSARKNQLYVVACRISTPKDSWEGSKVEDCSMRVSLMFPTVLSIRNTSRTVGYIWSNKAFDSSGYFNEIRFYAHGGSHSVDLPGLKYEYSLVNGAINSCPKKQSNRNRGKKYPHSDANDLRFHISISNPREKISRWGYANPVSIDDKIAPSNYWSSSSLDKQNDEAELRPMNISYIVSLTSISSNNASSKDYEQVEISAEGVYDGETGVLCMVGCKFFNSSKQISKDDSVDCDIHVSVQFPPLNSRDRIEGRIESTSDKTSPLYFKSLSFSSVPFYSHKDSIWRMDLEIIMALISNTLACVSVGYQILYVKKHPGMFPFISLAMLAVLTLGQMIPLVLNFEALFVPKQNRQSVMLRGGGWLEVNEVIVRVVTMIAFLLQFRLLQLVFSARFSNANQKASWIAEKRTLYVCLPIYAVGGLTALWVSWRNYKHGNHMNSRGYYYYNDQQSLWVDFRSYAGLVLDGFLLPQTVFNIFHNSSEKALSWLFYMGITFVRLLPHAYDLYRTHYFVDDFDSPYSYMYADRSVDYFSSAWDVIIPLVGLLFAAMIYLQQRNGGRCFLPKRFNQLQGYEKVPEVSDV